jgi:hypothetical protein
MYSTTGLLLLRGIKPIGILRQHCHSCFVDCMPCNPHDQVFLLLDRTSTLSSLEIQFQISLWILLEKSDWEQHILVVGKIESATR